MDMVFRIGAGGSGGHGRYCSLGALGDHGIAAPMVGCIFTFTAPLLAMLVNPAAYRLLWHRVHAGDCPDNAGHACASENGGCHCHRNRTGKFTRSYDPVAAL